MKDVWKFSCRPPCCHVSAFGQARSIKCLPTMSLSHSTMVCTLPRVWCEAGLIAMLTVRFPVSNSIEKLEWPLAIARRYATHIPSRLCLTTKCLSCRQEFKKTLTWFNRQKFKCPACGSELDQQPLRDLASVAYLAFRLYWDGNESWEGTDWKDTPKNRARAEAMSVIISDHMENGTFDY